MIFYFSAILGIIILAVVVYSNVKIDVTEVEISSDKSMTFLHLSDLHKKKFGENYEKIFAKIPKNHYDGIFFTGDLISRSEKDFGKKIEFMKRLGEIAPVYFVGGNHEADVPKSYAQLCAELEKVGVVVLRNQSVNLDINGKKITVAGLEPEGRFYKNPDGGYRKLPTFDDDYLTDKLGQKGENYTILLAHSPFEMGKYAKWGADIVLCGHVHGGVVRLPILGGILSPERKFFPKYSGGIYTENNTQMIVSRGLGKFRIFNNSQIIQLKFKEQKNDR